MSAIHKKDLHRLVSHFAPHSVSILMPTHRGGQETRQDPIRLKNLIARAEEQLIAQGVRHAEARDRLDRVRRLLEDSGFWREQDRGLAVYLADGEPMILRVPCQVPELAVVSDRFHVKPLLPLALDHLHFYLLRLSENVVQLYRCDRYEMTPVEVPDIPHDIEDLMKYIDDEKQMQWHTRTTVSGSPRVNVPQSARRGMVAFGTGSSSDKDIEKKWTLEFCRLIDDGIAKHLAAHNEPLLVAAAEPTWALYREANHYSHMVGQPLPGNPDRVDLRALHCHAVDLLQPTIEQQTSSGVDGYHQFEGTDRALDDVSKIAEAAHAHQVDTAFVSLEDQVWGRFDEQTWRAEVHEQRQPGDQDLLDLIAVQTYTNGGIVYLVSRDKVPSGTRAAAILRFKT